MSSGLEDDILRSLRRITRSIDLHSRKLANSFGLTGPQLVCLRLLEKRGSAKPSEMAREVSLSQATVTGIVDRLAARQLVARERKEKDRRVVTVSITDAGRALVEQAPSPLQETFLKRLRGLTPIEQIAIRDLLARIVRMMDGEDLEAAPILSNLPKPIGPEEDEPAPATLLETVEGE